MGTVTGLPLRLADAALLSYACSVPLLIGAEAALYRRVPGPTETVWILGAGLIASAAVARVERPRGRRIATLALLGHGVTLLVLGAVWLAQDFGSESGLGFFLGLLYVIAGLGLAAGAVLLLRAAVVPGAFAIAAGVAILLALLPSVTFVLGPEVPYVIFSKASGGVDAPDPRNPAYLVSLGLFVVALGLAFARRRGAQGRAVACAGAALGGIGFALEPFLLLAGIDWDVIRRPGAVFADGDTVRLVTVASLAVAALALRAFAGLCVAGAAVLGARSEFQRGARKPPRVDLQRSIHGGAGR
ncbi:MAG: hypothetical protein ACT4PT_02650 [Methanobacteriota archaeon]